MHSRVAGPSVAPRRSAAHPQARNSKRIKGHLVTEASDLGEAQAAPQQHAELSVPARSMSVWARIKEHKVAQWTLAYAAGAYTLLHSVEMVSDALDWPHLVVRILTLCCFSVYRSQRRSHGSTATERNTESAALNWQSLLHS